MTQRYIKIMEAVTELLKIFGLYLGHVWHVEDVHRLCRHHGFEPLSNGQAAEVLEMASKHCMKQTEQSDFHLNLALLNYMERVEATA